MYTVNMTGSKRGYHHGDLRAALLREATALLERYGPEGISFRAVTRAVGVSPNAPYNHFASRHDLLAAIAEGGFTELAERQERTAAAAEPADAWRALGRDYLEFAVQHPQLYRLMFGAGVAHWREVPAVAVAKGRSIQPLRSLVRHEPAALGSWSLAHGLAMLLIDGSLDHAAAVGGGPDRLIDAVLGWFVDRQISG